MSESRRLEVFYTLHPWIENFETAEGLKRYREVVELMERVTSHPWFRELVESRKRVKIIDVCSGTGIGGIALSRVLRDRGVEVALTLVDLRLSALEKGRKFAVRELGFEPLVVTADVTQPLDLQEKHDVALMWGNTTPHFNPWMWLRVLVNISRVLDDNGLFAYDEVDKVYSLFMSRGFREVKPQIVREDKIVLDIFAGRDGRSGSVKHLYVNILTGERVEIDLYYWDIASSAAFTWIFFEDVDYLPTTSKYSGVIVARKPRRILNLGDFIVKTPTMLRNKSVESTTSM